VPCAFPFWAARREAGVSQQCIENRRGESPRAAAHRKNSGRQKHPLPFWDMVLLLKLLLASAFGFVLLAL
jgi:hypothetical protein